MSVRLSEGGAATVARTLADEMATMGVESDMIYGYGPSGRQSPLETRYGAVRLTSRSLAGVNKIAHDFLGAELEVMGRGSRQRLRDVFSRVDLVHLHVTHSYFIGFETLVQELIASGKPVVWTLHDQWIMTGRCAQPANCTLWREGCPSCPTLSAYPPARVDHARAQWTRRRQLVSELRDALPTAIVACARWLADEAKEAGLEDVDVVQNSVDGEFWKAATSAPHPERTSDTPRFLFINRDLRDRGKVDWPLLTSVALRHDLTIVGDNVPGPIPRARLLPAIMDRSALAGEMARHDALVFTSKVDYYPLTLAEASTAGLRVLALRSRAAEEFSDASNVLIFDDSTQLEAALGNTAARSSSDDIQPGLAQRFSPPRMAADYLDIYRRLLGRR